MAALHLLSHTPLLYLKIINICDLALHVHLDLYKVTEVIRINERNMKYKFAAIKPQKPSQETEQSDQSEVIKQDDSEYESDKGTQYINKGVLGCGKYAKVKLFESLDGTKKKAIISPHKDKADFIEAFTKRRFYNTIYSTEPPLFLYNSNQTNYRLIVPYIPGRPYHHLSLKNEKERVILFISAVIAIQDCHDKKLIIMDLKADNINYDGNFTLDSSKSYLIDGGLSIKEGHSIPDVFEFENEEEL